MPDVQIYAVVVTEEHELNAVFAGNSLLIRTKDKKEQDAIVREVALAVAGDVVRLSNGMVIIVTANR